MAGPGVPEKTKWMPAASRDLEDQGKSGCVADMHRYLERMLPRTCEICRPRWFPPDCRFAVLVGVARVGGAKCCMRARARPR